MLHFNLCIQMKLDKPYILSIKIEFTYNLACHELYLHIANIAFNFFLTTLNILTTVTYYSNKKNFHVSRHCGNVLSM